MVEIFIKLFFPLLLSLSVPVVIAVKTPIAVNSKNHLSEEKTNGSTRTAPEHTRLAGPRKSIRYLHQDAQQSSFEQNHFKSLLLSGDAFVDKSILIKEILEHVGVITAIRPRRTGKSINLSMIKTFFEVEVDPVGRPLPKEARQNRVFFTGGEIIHGNTNKTLRKLKVTSDDIIMTYYQGEFPVMLLNLTGVNGATYSEMEANIITRYRKMFLDHLYLRDSNQVRHHHKERLETYFSGEITTHDMEIGLWFLSKVLFRRYRNKAFILVDSYDTPINNAYLEFGENAEDFRKIKSLFNKMFASGFKGSIYLENAIMTGIVEIEKTDMFSVADDFIPYTLLSSDSFADFYGFTQQEVDELVARVPTITNPNHIKHWYNGFNFGKKVIYNPWSVRHCLTHKGTLDFYWLHGIGVSFADAIFQSEDMQEDFQRLLLEGSLLTTLQWSISVESAGNIFHKLLLYEGYLNAIPIEERTESGEISKEKYHVTIPNSEIREIYVSRVTSWVIRKLNIPINDYYAFVNFLCKGKVETFKKKFLQYFSSIKQDKKWVLVPISGNTTRLLIGGIVSSLMSRYVVQSSGCRHHNESSLYILIPWIHKKDCAIILQYVPVSVNETTTIESAAKNALQEINEEQFESVIKGHSPHVEKFVKVGLAFRAGKVAMECQVDGE